MTDRKMLYQSPGQAGKRGFEDLDCYKLALEAMAGIHEMVKQFPIDEKFDLTAQIRRSSKSVIANIAEGYGRYHYLDSLHKYSIARGELNETLAHLITAKVLGYIDQTAFELLYNIIREAEQTLNGYMAYVRRNKAGSQEFGDKAIQDNSTVYIVGNTEDEQVT